MSLCNVESGTTVFKQGSLGNYFYILKEGAVELYINDTFMKSISNWESFGELALLHRAPRSGTIKATKNCEFWVLERKNFRKIIDFISEIQFEENKKFIQSIPILCNYFNVIKQLLIMIRK